MNEETEDYVHKMKKEHGSVFSKSFGSSLKICKVAEDHAHCYPRFDYNGVGYGSSYAIATYRLQMVMLSQQTLSYNKENLLKPFFVI